MKRYFLIVSIIVSVTFTMTAQTGFECKPLNTVPSPTSAPNFTTQPANCRQLLMDLAPVPGDRYLELNTRIIVFAPTGGTGAWNQSGHVSTYSDALAALNVVNATFTNQAYPIPALNPGNDTTSNVRIKLALHSFTTITDNSAYYQDTAILKTYSIPNCLNVYFTSGLASGVPYYKGKHPNNYMIISENSSQGWDNVSLRGNTIAHEAGHMLGLNHTNWAVTSVLAGTVVVQSDTGYDKTWINPDFGCCTAIEADDFIYDEAKWDPCTYLGGNGTNNLMNGQVACGNDFLTPLQAAVARYNLIVNGYLQGYFTTASYTAATEVNHYFDYNVTSNQTWQNGDRYMKGDIIIKPGKTLTIKCGVAMTHGAKIIVEKTGLLVVDGGTITNISGRTWDGIHVHGDPNLAQTISPLYQGMVTLKNGAVISQAEIGVRNHFGSTATSIMGGIIYATNSYFVNNIIDVQLLGPVSTAAQIPNGSRFYGCQFINNGYIANTAKPVTHVNLYRTTGSVFLGCTFSNTQYPNYGYGIKSVNSSCLVDKWGSTPTLFTSLRTAIFINNYFPLLTPLIRNTKIQDFTLYGVYSMNANGLSLQTCTIQPYPQHVSSGSGVYLNNNKYYKIKYNLFIRPGSNANYCDPGMEIYKSQAGTHEVFGNTFSNQYVALNVMDDNGNNTDGLKINCDDFHQQANKYDVVLSYTSGLNPPRVMQTQGDISAAANATTVVRNIYGATCNTGQNKWQISSISPSTINHGCNINTLTAVTHPTATGCKSSFLNSVEKNISLNYPQHCPGTTQSAGGTGTSTSQKLENMNSYITELREDNEENQNHFEIQSTVAGKISLFMNDTLGPRFDSLITILQNNQGDMEDADLQLIFAYLSIGNFTAASSAIDVLPPSRSDWENLLDKLLELEQDTMNGIFSLNIDSDERNFFLNYATSDTLEGKALAQALLKEACDSAYTEPHALPEGEGARPENATGTFETLSNIHEGYIEVYPNPTQSGATVRYINNSAETIRIELKDLLGREIYTKFSNQGSTESFIPMEHIANGMYVLSIIENTKIIYTTKIIKKE